MSKKDRSRNATLLRTGVSEGVLRGFEKDPFGSHGFLDNVHKGIAAGRSRGAFQKPFYQARVLQISPDTRLPMNSAYGHLIGYLHAFYGGTSKDMAYRGGDFLLVYGEVIEREGRMGMLEINSSNDYARLDTYPLFVGSSGATNGAYPTLGDLMEVMYYDPDNPLKGGIILRHMPIFNVPYGPPRRSPGSPPPPPGTGKTPTPPLPTPPSPPAPSPGTAVIPAPSSPTSIVPPGPTPTTPAASAVDYKLNGYTLDDLNPRNATATGPGIIMLEHLPNVVQTLNCLEVLHAYLSQDSAGNLGVKEVVIKVSPGGGYDQLPGKQHGNSWKNHIDGSHKNYGKGKGIAHPLGTALDLKLVKVGGKKLNPYQVYMAWSNLIKANKVPNGGLGFYFKTGLASHSDIPHYDHWGPSTAGFSKSGPRKWFHEGGKSITKKNFGDGWSARKKKARQLVVSKGKKGLPKVGPNVPSVTDIQKIRTEQQVAITEVGISGKTVAELLNIAPTQAVTAEQFMQLAHRYGSTGALF